MGWTRDLWNIGYPSLTTPTSFYSQKILFNGKEQWVQTYSNKKEINFISPSNIRASVENRPLKLHNLLEVSPPFHLWLFIAFYGPPLRASRGSAIHVFLVKVANCQIWMTWNSSFRATEKNTVHYSPFFQDRITWSRSDWNIIAHTNLKRVLGFSTIHIFAIWY